MVDQWRRRTTLTVELPFSCDRLRQTVVELTALELPPALCVLAPGGCTAFRSQSNSNMLTHPARSRSAAELLTSRATALKHVSVRRPSKSKSNPLHHHFSKCCELLVEKQRSY